MNKIERIKYLIENLNKEELSKLNSLLESKFTRAADTDAQEKGIKKLEGWLKKVDIKIIGMTAVGAHPQKAVISLSGKKMPKVTIDSDGDIMIGSSSIKKKEDLYSILGINKEEEILNDEEMETLEDEQIEAIDEEERRAFPRIGDIN